MKARSTGETIHVYSIPDAIEAKYKGAGHAIAAVANGQLVDLRYVHDIAPDYDSDAPAALEKIIMSGQLDAATQELKEHGEVVVGMCSSWEFVVL